MPERIAAELRVLTYGKTCDGEKGSRVLVPSYIAQQHVPSSYCVCVCQG